MGHPKFSRRNFMTAGSMVIGTLAAAIIPERFQQGTALAAGSLRTSWSASTPPTLQPLPQVTFPTLFTQMDGAGDPVSRGWGADLARIKGLTTLVAQGMNDNQLLQQVPGIVPKFRANAGKRVLLYQLPEQGYYARYALDKYRLRDPKGNLVTSPDNAQIMCVADPAYRALWIKYAIDQITEFGLDGLFTDGPAGWGRTGKDSNGITQDRPHEANVQFFKEMRAALGNKYISANVGGSYYYDHNWPGSSEWDFAPYIDEYCFELPFSPDGKVEHYDSVQLSARMREMRKVAFDLKRNIMIWSTSGAPADRQLFEYACHLMFVGHPFSGPSAGWGSVVQYGVHTATDARSQAFKWTRSSLGNPLEEPQVNGAVWTRRFEKGTVKADLKTATGTIG